MSHRSVSQSWVDNGDLDALILDSLEQGKSPAAHRMLGSNIGSKMAILQKSKDRAGDDERGVTERLHRLLKIRQGDLAEVHDRGHVCVDGLLPVLEWAVDAFSDSSCDVSIANK